jgi:hypothetical protein
MLRSLRAAGVLLLQLVLTTRALTQVKVKKHVKHSSKGGKLASDSVETGRSASDSLATSGLTADGLRLESGKSQTLTADGLIIDGSSDSTDAAGPAQEGDSDAGSAVSRSPEETAAMRDEAFEKEFNVELDVAKAQAGVPLGVKVDVKSEFQPLSVRMINDGLVSEWNKLNPDKEILVGDQITMVNGNVWHHNTRDFGTKMKAMFQAVKKNTPGAEAFLNMSIQRPRSQDADLPVQLQDLHKRLYAKDFEAQLVIPGRRVERGNSLADTLGWQLNMSTEYWMPVMIGEVSQQGLVAEWNKKNPENTILPGDEIMGINNVTWQHNSYAFIEKVVKEFEAARSGRPEHKGPVKIAVSVRRLRPAREVKLANVGHQIPKVKEATVSKTTSFLTSLPIPKNVKQPQSKIFGWQLSSDSDSTPPVIGKIRTTGLVAKWNKAHPDKEILPGDMIIEVNNFPQEQLQGICRAHRQGVPDLEQEGRCDTADVLEVPAPHRRGRRLRGRFRGRRRRGEKPAGGLLRKLGRH